VERLGKQHPQRNSGISLWTFRRTCVTTLEAKVFLSDLKADITRTEMWSDASGSRLGWLVTSDGKTTARSEKLRSISQIYTAELLAAVQGADRGKRVTVNIDNQAAWKLPIKKVVLILRRYDRDTMVPSNCNRADPASRGAKLAPFHARPCDHRTEPRKIRWLKKKGGTHGV
jgi:hypothetical protein